MIGERVNPDELFARFPERVLRSFKRQLLLGAVPSEVVAEIFEPFLTRFFDLALGLPPDLQADLENILRIYPDVAERFGLRMTPPLLSVLSALPEHFAQLRGLSGEYRIDEAAEQQARFCVSPPRLWEGQGFFRTDKGSAVYLELRYAEGEDIVSFKHIPDSLDIQIAICGEPVLRLGYQRRSANVAADTIAALLAKWRGAGPLVEIFENPGNAPGPPSTAKPPLSR